MSISVIICSRNRCPVMRRCLNKIPVGEMQSLGAELVVVNNGSTDNTQDVLDHFQQAAPFRVVTVQEPRPGLGRARNAGIARSSGTILFFTDDDCYIAPGTLSRLPGVYSGNIRYAGGRILLYDPTDASYTINEMEKFHLIPPRSVIPAGFIQGANMSCHREVIDRISGFDPNLGLGRFSAEDIVFAARASFAGFTGTHVPDLVVYHHHGRKRHDIHKHMKRDDYARGTYYARMILNGHIQYVAWWARQVLTSRPGRILREVSGAVSYAGLLLTRGLSGYQ